MNDLIAKIVSETQLQLSEPKREAFNRDLAKALKNLNH